MKIVVIGAGGLGGFFGGRLAAAGNDVTFVARGEHLHAMLSNGLRIESETSPLLVRPVRAVCRGEDAGPADLVIVAVKRWDTTTAVASVRRSIDARTAVVSFQNGVDAADVIGDAIGQTNAIGGVAYVGVSIESPGVIRHTGTMQRLLFGELYGTLSSRVEAFARACSEAGIAHAVSPDIRRAMWEKFVFLVGLSATTCVFRRGIGPIRAHARGRALLLAIMREVVDVGRASGISLDPDFAERRLEFVDTLPEGMTASMYGDLVRGKRLELPWLSEYVTILGARVDVATPANRFVTDVLSLDANGTPA